MISLLILVSCGKEQSVEEVIETGDLSKIRARKSELSAQQSELNSKIAELDAAIEALDDNSSFTLVEVRQVSDSLFKHYVEVPGM